MTLCICVFVQWDGLVGPSLTHGCKLCMVSGKSGREVEGERERNSECSRERTCKVCLLKREREKRRQPGEQKRAKDKYTARVRESSKLEME